MCLEKHLFDGDSGLPGDAMPVQSLFIYNSNKNTYWSRSLHLSFVADEYLTTELELFFHIASVIMNIN